MIYCGDSLEVLKGFEDNSIDAVVTDPPYGLSFMGKKWDYDVPSQEIWEECLRVLKPGGYLLAFAGTRTQHRMAVNIEDAGFEIRDMIAWIYGSGFPKSLNIGKAVDKLQGNERDETDYIAPDGKKRWGGNSFSVGEEPDGRGINKATKGTSEWEGWGTALKPALEPITVARKPLSEKTVAENCLKWGVGGINIDDCRVESSGKDLEKLNSEWDREWNTDYSTYADKVGGSAGFNMDSAKVENKGITGRFPANLIHDGSDEVVSLFPNTKGSSGSFSKSDYSDNENGSTNFKRGDFVGRNDSGSASRFFYCAKASKSERNKGCEKLEEKIVNDGREKDIDNAFQRGSTLRKNTHPTVKPIALMEYLVELVSKENAVVLDPFMGSGTTGIACKKLNRQFIGIEREQEYIDIAQARIDAWEPEAQQELL